MVGPSTTAEEREDGMQKLMLSVVGLVAVSGALVPLYADAAPVYVGAGALFGALLGFALWKYMVWAYRDGSSKREERDRSGYEKRERFK